YALGTLVASAEALPATIRYTRSPSVFSDSSLSPSFLRTTAARKARTVCGRQPGERVTGAMVAPLGPHSSASTPARFEFARPPGRPLPAAFERILDADRALMVRAGLRLDMQNSSQERRRNSAPPPRKPRGGRSALAGKRSEPPRLGVRAHTPAPGAPKVQPNPGNGAAGFTRGGSSLDQRVREGAGCWPPGPSCVSPAPQLKREWSPWPEFGWFPANLRDFSKGYFATTFLSSNLTCPARQSGLCGPSQVCTAPASSQCRGGLSL